MELKNGTLGVYLGVDPHTPDPRDYNLFYYDPYTWLGKQFSGFNSEEEDQIAKLQLKLNSYEAQIKDLHEHNHKLIENQSKIEQKARTQQRQYDAKVYAYWKKKAETLASKVFFLENEVKKTEILQKIVSKLMDRIVDRSKKLIAIKQILDGSSESCSE